MQQALCDCSSGLASPHASSHHVDHCLTSLTDLDIASRCSALETCLTRPGLPRQLLGHAGRPLGS